MSLDSIVNVTLTLQTAAPSQVGFGVPLLAAYHAVYVDRVRSYKTHAAVVADFGAEHMITKAAAVVFGQSPRPKELKIGRRALPFTKSFEFTPTDTTEGLVYSITFEDSNGVEETASYTVAASDTVALIIDGLVTAITAFTTLALTPTDDITKLTVDADNAGDLFRITGISPELDVKDVTTDPGIATDLAAILVADADWYGLALDSQSQAEVEAAAAWVEANGRFFMADSADADLKGSGSADMASTIEAAAYARTHVDYHHEIGSFLAAGRLAVELPQDPGSTTLEYKTVSGVTVTPRAYLTDTQKSNLEGKKAGWYTTIAGINVTVGSRAGSGTFLDLTRGSDWFVARLKERLFGLLVNSAKIPYTDAGVELVKAEIYALCGTAKKRGVFDPAFESVVDAPAVADVDVTDRANRLLPDVVVADRFSGALHNFDISVTLSV